MSFSRLLPLAVLLAGFLPTALAQSENGPPIMLPPVHVTAPFLDAYQTLNQAVDGPFPSLRNGEMIEAILWRHRYLEKHAGEDAIIVTTWLGNWIISATTVYTENGRVYASSNVLGEHVALDGILPSDLRELALRPKIRQQIILLERSIVAAGGFGFQLLRAQRTGDYTEDGPNPNAPPLLQVAPPMELSGAASRGSGPTSGTASNGTSAKKSGGASNSSVGTVQSSRHESSNSGSSGTNAMAVMEYHRALAMADGQRDFQAASWQNFLQPADTVLNWAYRALRDPARAGFIPVTVGPVDMVQPLPHSSTSLVRALIFDWDGAQYLYHPDIGMRVLYFTRMQPVGAPHLCVKDGAVLEAVYFCAMYSLRHPAARLVVIPDPPVVVALAGGKELDRLNLYWPSTGEMIRTGNSDDLIGDWKALRQLRSQAVAGASQGSHPATKTIPDAMAGDDADLQVRRVYLAFRDAGISCQFHGGDEESFGFQWKGRSYHYGSDRVLSLAETP